MKKHLLFLVLIFAILITPSFAKAATLNISIDKTAVAIGDEFTANLKINSENVSINVAQATLQFNRDILEVKKVEKTDSVFTLWLAEPEFSNTAGTVSFLGGAVTGVSGQSLQTLRITFRAKGAGKATISLTDSAVIASDGSGTNVLTSANGLELDVLTKKGVIGPAQITREPGIASGLPAKPEVKIPLYSDPKKWYGVSQDFSATFSLPVDVTNVAAVVNKVSAFDPTVSEGLFDNKNFKALSDGISYLHVRFKNKIGWGVTNHYRLAVDTAPPAPFIVEVASGPISDNPTPVFTFQVSDQLSGISEYAILINNQETAKTKSGSYRSNPLPPGKYNISVSAKDEAGNTTTSMTELEVLPIPSPEVTSFSQDVYVGEGGVTASGVSLPDSKVLMTIKNQFNGEVSAKETEVNENGAWLVIVDDPLKRGRYSVEVWAQDARGALSLPVKLPDLNIRLRPILTIGNLKITADVFIIILIVFFALSFAAGLLVQRFISNQRKRKIVVAARDVEAFLGTIRKDVVFILQKHGVSPKDCDPGVESETGFLLKKIDDRIKKFERYILENIEEIR